MKCAQVSNVFATFTSSCGANRRLQSITIQPALMTRAFLRRHLRPFNHTTGWMVHGGYGLGIGIKPWKSVNKTNLSIKSLLMIIHVCMYVYVYIYTYLYISYEWCTTIIAGARETLEKGDIPTCGCRSSVIFSGLIIEDPLKKSQSLIHLLQRRAL